MAESSESNFWQIHAVSPMRTPQHAATALVCAGKMMTTEQAKPLGLCTADCDDCTWTGPTRRLASFAHLQEKFGKDFDVFSTRAQPLSAFLPAQKGPSAKRLD